MTEEELKEAGLNRSDVHVDFMIGSNQMDIDGIRQDGRTNLPKWDCNLRVMEDFSRLKYDSWFSHWPYWASPYWGERMGCIGKTLLDGQVLCRSASFLGIGTDATDTAIVLGTRCCYLISPLNRNSQK